ncbi:lyase family protein [Salinarimonas soli]|nr:lyase family protein [Salinarimonas soli]
MRDVFSDEARVAAMVTAEAALARAQARFGLVPDGLADAIAAVGARDLDPAALGAATAVVGVPVIPFLKALQSRLPADLEPHVHKGATTQDIADTALVIQLRAGLRLIAHELGRVLLGLERLAGRHRATPCAGRTYGQHAAPVTFGFKAAVWATGIADVAARLPGLVERSLVPSLGGPVGTFAAMGGHGPAVLDAFAAELGFRAPPLAWHTRRAALSEIGTWVAMLLGALGKFAGDVAHLATTEVGEVAEPAMPGRGGSSAMPHKRNPVGATLILSAGMAAKGHVVTLLDAMVAAHERPAGAWHAEWHALPSLFGLASGALREAALLAEGLVVDAERMSANLQITRGLLFADAVAGRLAGVLGREAAHAAVERAAQRVRGGTPSLEAALRDDAALAALPPDLLDTSGDLEGAVEAASLWVDRALPTCARARAELAALA